MKGCELFDEKKNCNCLEYNKSINVLNEEYYYDDENYYTDDIMGDGEFDFHKCDFGCDYSMRKYVYPNYTVIKDSNGLLENIINNQNETELDSLIQECDEQMECASISLDINGEGNIFNSHRHIHQHNYSFLKKNNYYTTTTGTETSTSNTETSTSNTETSTSNTETSTTQTNTTQLPRKFSSSQKKSRKGLTAIYVIIGVILISLAGLGLMIIIKKKITPVGVVERTIPVISYDNPLYDSVEEDNSKNYQDINNEENYLEIEDQDSNV